MANFFYLLRFVEEGRRCVWDCAAEETSTNIYYQIWKKPIWGKELNGVDEEAGAEYDDRGLPHVSHSNIHSTAPRTNSTTEAVHYNIDIWSSVRLYRLHVVQSLVWYHLFPLSHQRERELCPTLLILH